MFQNLQFLLKFKENGTQDLLKNQNNNVLKVKESTIFISITY